MAQFESHRPPLPLIAQAQSRMKPNTSAELISQDQFVFFMTTMMPRPTSGRACGFQN
jgi:hypothetical protein